MAEALRILILEDNLNDVELVKFELEEAGFVFTSKAVMTEEDYIRELQEFSPDLILSDYDLPEYNGASALAEARRRYPDTPFILVTGAVTEDRAIDILTQGAKDYVLKTRLEQRLAPAVRRALAEAEEHKARKQAEAELRESHRTLEERVKIRTAELEVEIAARVKMQEALLQDITERKQAEEALKESERRFRSVLDNSRDVIYRMNLQTGHYDYVSPSSRTLVGYSPEELMAMDDESSIALIHPDDLTAWQVGLVQISENGTGELEYRQKTKNGDYHWFSNHISITFDSEGRPLFRNGNIRDITPRKQVEQALRASEENFRALAENIPDQITRFDRNLRFLYANPAVLERLGLPLEMLIGKAAHEYGAAPAAAIHWERAARDVLESGEPRRYEHTSHWKGETQILDVHIVPQLDADGMVTAVIAIARDITERKKTEEALKEKEAQYHLLFENMVDGFAYHRIVTDEGGEPIDYVFLEMNKAFEQMTGLQKENILGKTIREVLPGTADDPADWIRTYGEVALTGKDIHFEQFSEQLEKWYSVSAYSPMKGHFVTLFSDITEFK